MMPEIPEDWAHQVVGNLDAAVTKLYNLTVRPAYLIGRIVTFGLIVAVLALVSSIAVYIGIVRLLDTYAFGNRVWITDLAIGGVMIFSGFLLWSKRRPHK
ncbi:MAG: hypothetical protein M1399_02345 [Actinobacteria bacterium]|nr:hypothetical protein [Actinomycetota bacterium]MCL5445934.1 hypothetical protein [Actinomycetota bacterium]